MARATAGLDPGPCTLVRNCQVMDLCRVDRVEFESTKTTNLQRNFVYGATANLMCQYYRLQVLQQGG